ncbi:MAG: hypothetical protein HY883_00240 [Deltaproteobacteria bacterium]|nr:hypothetical protein [Deltaproteobacteria bacterium]
MKITITGHARFEASRRGISEDLIKSVVKAPQQKLSSKKGRIVVQKKYYDKIESKEMLLRVIGTETEGEFNRMLKKSPIVIARSDFCGCEAKPKQTRRFLAPLGTGSAISNCLIYLKMGLLRFARKDGNLSFSATC